jgi:hypothetical protein
MVAVQSDSVLGSATKVVGCGTIYATSGSFSGSATIIGCGSASGYGTLDGSGTVYPAALGGMVGITSSGRITGSGSVIGCGTIVGTSTPQAGIASRHCGADLVADREWHFHSDGSLHHNILHDCCTQSGHSRDICVVLSNE